MALIVRPPTPNRQLSNAGMTVLQHAEASGGIPALIPYLDSKGVPTNGWGNTHNVDMRVPITRAQAIADLHRNAAAAEHAVCELVKVPLNDNQFDALVICVFNIGVEAFRTSTLLRRLNAGEYSAIPAELARWNKVVVTDHVSGKKVAKVVPGLTNRRAIEASLFVTPVGLPSVPVPAPQPLVGLLSGMDKNGADEHSPAAVAVAGVRLSGVTPQPPANSLAQAPGGKSTIAALLAGLSGAIVEGYNQVQPVLDAVQQMAYGMGSSGQLVQVIGAVLALASIGSIGYAMWRQHQAVQGA